MWQSLRVRLCALFLFSLCFILLITYVQTRQLLSHENGWTHWWLVVGFSFAVGCCVLLFAIHRLFARLQAVQFAMQQAASHEGDLGYRLPVNGQDEIHQLANSFNLLTGDVCKTIIQLSLSLSRLSGAQAKTVDVTNLSMHTIIQLQDQLTLTATAVEEMSATAQEVSRNIVETSHAANQAKQETDNGAAVLEQVLQEIIRVSDNANTANDVVSRLSVESNAMGDMVNVINGIAEQTNLLALNAAIEAARAGEQGRGFAVVADEVRQLASRTQESTREIQLVIQKLQDGMKQAVKIIEQNTELAQATAEKTTVASEALTNIAAAIRQIHDMATQVATASEQQSATTVDTNEKVHMIQVHSETVTDNSRQIIENTQSVSDNLNQLITSAQAFRMSDAIGLELALAKSAHLAWRAKICNLLSGKVKLDKRELTDHTLCILGKWYYGEGQKKLAHDNYFKQIEAPHKEMHKLVFDAVAAIERRDIEKAKQLSERVSELSTEIVHLIEQMETSFASSWL